MTVAAMAKAPRMVPITDAVLHTSYKPVILPAGTYAFQPEPVRTIASKTLLMTYEYGSEKNAYYKDACKSVADFTSLIVGNLDLENLFALVRLRDQRGRIDRQHLSLIVRGAGRCRNNREENGGKNRPSPFLQIYGNHPLPPNPLIEPR